MTRMRKLTRRSTRGGTSVSAMTSNHPTVRRHILTNYMKRMAQMMSTQRDEEETKDLRSHPLGFGYLGIG